MATQVPGTRKPLNQLEGPVYPRINATLPQFKWSRKHWTVGEDVLMSAEADSIATKDIVLAQPRDYHETIYGKTSLRQTVNANFRPPLLDPYLDHVALNRIPVKIEPIMGRINPGTAFGDNGTSAYFADNSSRNDIEKHLTDTVSTGWMRPTFYRPMHTNNYCDIPEPDLQTKLPSFSVSSGYNCEPSEMARADITIEYQKLNPISAAGYTLGMDVAQLENKVHELFYKTPQTAAAPGMTTIFNHGVVETQILELEHKLPITPVATGVNCPFGSNLTGEGIGEDLANSRKVIVEGASGFDSGYTQHIETPIRDLLDKMPQTPVSASTSTVYSRPLTDVEVRELRDKRPQAAVDAGFELVTRVDGYNASENTRLQQRTGTGQVIHVNPGSESMTSRVDSLDEMNRKETYTRDRLDTVPYVARGTSSYREKNEMSHMPEMRKKLQPLKSYGQITFGGAMPKAGYISGGQHLSGAPEMMEISRPKRENFKFVKGYSLGK